MKPVSSDLNIIMDLVGRSNLICAEMKLCGTARCGTRLRDDDHVDNHAAFDNASVRAVCSQKHSELVSWVFSITLLEV